MNDKNFEILEAVYGNEAYEYIVEYIIKHAELRLCPAEAAKCLVSEEGFEEVLDFQGLSDYDRNSGMF